MIAEVIDNDLATIKNVIKKLKGSPDIVKTLSQYSKDINNILALSIIVEPITKEDIIKSQMERNNYGNGTVIGGICHSHESGNPESHIIT